VEKGHLVFSIHDGLEIKCPLSPVEGNKSPWDLGRSCYHASRWCTCIFHAESLASSGAAASFLRTGPRFDWWSFSRWNWSGHLVRVNDSAIGISAWHLTTSVSILLHCPFVPHAFTGIDSPSSSLDSIYLDTRAKAQSSQRLASVAEDASSTTEALMAWHCDARRIIVLSQHWSWTIWSAPGETLPDPERHTIQSPKSMLTIIWGLTWFHVVNLLPNGGTLNAASCTDEIVSEIACWREAQRGSTNRKLVVHADNTRPHTAGRTVRYIEACGMVRAPHSPDSPDLAVTDFFLFGCLSGMLRGRHFETGEELWAAIRDLLGTIEKVTLARVFLKWMEGLAKSIRTSGEYVGGDE
jgi:hypothetical protein